MTADTLERPNLAESEVVEDDAEDDSVHIVCCDESRTLCGVAVDPDGCTSPGHGLSVCRFCAVLDDSGEGCAAHGGMA